MRERSGTDRIVGAVLRAVLSVLVAIGIVGAADHPLGGTFRVGTLLDPVDGLWLTARQAERSGNEESAIEGLSSSVQVIRDDRGVPHIFAGSDEDAIRAFGFVVAQDRLFQMDFLRRYTSGRLSHVLGDGALPVDRAMRQAGILESVTRNLEAARAEDRMTAHLFDWFVQGVNAFLGGLDERDLPFEFRLFDYRPEPFTSVDLGLIGWNLVYDLTYEREAAVDRELLADAFPPGEFDRLFPRYQQAFRPIVPPEEAWWRTEGATEQGRERDQERSAEPLGLGPWGEGFVEGKGSNNWAVAGSRSTTGAPILAGDMHLSLTLPSIWYEVHLVTPEMDTYGVTVPGVPLPIEAFNRHLGWAFTNTGSDQIDHLLLETDASRSRYRYDSTWLPLEWHPVRYDVRGVGSVEDSIAWSHWGPVDFRGDGSAVAVRWVGHDTLRTFDALWDMNRATGYAEFEQALRQWDSPMQNILVADMQGHLAIRSTGYLPVRADGGAPGLRDGTTSASAWTGRVPFDELPFVVDPERGYLTSTNQQPAEQGYPHYLGGYAASAWRSIRIDELLSGTPRHSPEEIASYQADPVAVAAVRLSEQLADLEISRENVEALRKALTAWDGAMDKDRFEPLAYDELVRGLAALTWDEPVFDGMRRPSGWALLDLIERDPESPWFDRISTGTRERAPDLLVQALSDTADSLDAWSGGEWEHLKWGAYHELELRHVTMTPALSAIWRGPFAFDGTFDTLSPGAGRRVRFGASWRVVLDFSSGRPAGRGMYAGGPSGNPFSRRYDQYVDDFLHFRLRDLPTPASPTAVEAPSASLMLRPLTIPAPGP